MKVPFAFLFMRMFALSNILNETVTRHNTGNARHSGYDARRSETEQSQNNPTTSQRGVEMLES